jgi:hypothetical protein
MLLIFPFVCCAAAFVNTSDQYLRMDDLRAIDATEVDLKARLSTAFELIRGVLGNTALIPLAFESQEQAAGECVL